MIEIISTGDGSHTLRNIHLDETYHSVHGAIQESMHVFIRHGLDYVISQGRKSIGILEVGFGTGLNAFITMRRCIGQTIEINYTTLEPYPLEESIWQQLNYAEGEEETRWFNRLHKADWEIMVELYPKFRLTKSKRPVQDVHFDNNQFDLVYFDAFAPEKQPEMWSMPVLEKVTRVMKPGGVFVTYCAKGQVKRDLRSYGLKVETLQGPPGKREMVRAIKG